MVATGRDAADIVAVQQLAAHYAEAVSRLSVREAVEAYAADGVLSTPTTADVQGRDAIAELIESTISGLDLVFQTIHLGVVRVDGDIARARFPVTEWARRAADGRGIQFLGWYDDIAVRTAEGWRFGHRRLIPRTLGHPGGLTAALHPIPGAPFAGV
ncbi:nuclear transport factor 2 family protein [Nocardia sp. NBC_01388]|uniref:nuclear transport factor 2 family protein n=1 Tax=Nocardia sp. NBC_01388 TaxID=2903596 RepID=UPI00325555F6